MTEAKFFAVFPSIIKRRLVSLVKWICVITKTLFAVLGLSEETKVIYHRRGSRGARWRASSGITTSSTYDINTLSDPPSPRWRASRTLKPLPSAFSALLSLFCSFPREAITIMMINFRHSSKEESSPLKRKLKYDENGNIVRETFPLSESDAMRVSWQISSQFVKFNNDANAQLVPSPSPAL